MDWFKVIGTTILNALRLAGSKAVKGIGGVWGWLAGLAFPYIFDYVVKKPVQWALQKLEALYEKWRGGKAIDDIEKAKDNKESDDAVDRLP